MIPLTICLGLLATALQTPKERTFAVLEGAALVVVERGARRVVPLSEAAESFAWDHGGEHLLITRGASLERVRVRDGDAARLFDGAASGIVELRLPDVSPDGTRIVFGARRESSSDWRVVLLGRDGVQRDLCDGYDPCFTREGDGVLCERYPDRDLWRFDLASGALQREFAPQADRYTVQVDPYSARLAFSSRGRLVLRDLDAATESSFSPDGAYDRFASFSSDRRHVLFFRQHTPEGGELFRGIVERDLVLGSERVLASAEAQLAAYAPPSLAHFAARSDAARDPWLRRWLDTQAADAPQSHLYLSDVELLAPSEAAVLGEFHGAAIFLPGVRALEPASARLLARFEGSLFLDALASLDVATARALASWNGNGEQLHLSLAGLRDPSVEVLGALGECRGWGLSLEGLTKLTPELAGALGPIHVASLDLDGVTSIDRPTAEALSHWTAKFLSLRGWNERDPELERLVRRGCAELILR